MASNHPSILPNLLNPLDGHRVLAMIKVRTASIIDSFCKLNNLVTIAQLNPHALRQLHSAQNQLSSSEELHLVWSIVEQGPEAIFGGNCSVIGVGHFKISEWWWSRGPVLGPLIKNCCKS